MKRRITGMERRLTLLLLFCVWGFLSATAQAIRYVNASAPAGGNGSSWASAYNDLQAALEVAASGDQILVAAGTYKPSKDFSGSPSPGDAKTKTFRLKSGVQLLGGYNASTGARNVKTNKTILSGDLLGNDDGFANNTENVYHVVSANISEETVVDGFTITGGNANNFTLNGASNGAGLEISGTGRFVLSHCVIKTNFATSYGGGVNLQTSALVTDCVFDNNRSGNHGGAMMSTQPCTIVNSVFANNYANGSGGALLLYNTKSIINSTFYGNYGGFGAIYNEGNLSLNNSIIWGNTSANGAPALNNINSGTSTVTYSNVQGYSGGTNNASTNPLFVNIADLDGPDNTWGTTDDGLQLSTVSPVVDKGNNLSIPAGYTTDIIGSTRIQNSTVNMGAYEDVKVRVPQTIYVNASAPAGGNGSSWASAYNDLQAALEVAASGDQIWVAKGTYKPTKSSNGTIPGFPFERTRVFMLKNGVKLYGGFAGVEATLAARNTKLNKTILSGDHGILGDFSDNSYHVVAAYSLSTATELDGFTVTGGWANSGDQFLEAGYTNQFGGGLYTLHTGNNLTIKNTVFENNRANQLGGGVFLNATSPVQFEYCVFVNNTVANTGSGGGIHTVASAKVLNCVFTGNVAYNGAGIYVSGGAASIINCTITKNGNSNGAAGSGIYNDGGNPIITNTISWGNISFSANPDGFYSSGGSPLISYSTIQRSTVYPGTGNKNGDPLFVNSADGDGSDNVWGTADDGLVLNGNSPAANAGNDAVVPIDITTDILGDARKQGVVNMGAYETTKKANQTITGLPATATKVYGDIAYTLTASGGGSGNPIVYTSSNTAVATISGNTITIKGVGTTTISANQAGNDAYNDAPEVTQTLTVTPRPISVTADAASKIYGSTDPALLPKITAGSLVPGDAFTGSLKRVAGEDVGTYAIEQNTLAINANYNITYTNGTFTIDKRPITVTANARTKVYGTIDPAFTYAISTGNLIGADNLNGELSRAPGNNVGTYAINIGNLAHPNYAITFVPNNLTITQRDITITANAKNKTYGAADPGLTYQVTAGSLLPGDAFTGVLKRVAGENVGTYAIEQNTLANPNYNIVFIGANLTIDKRNITITANDVTKVVGQAKPFAGTEYSLPPGSLAFADAITGITIASAGAPAGAAVGTYDIVVSNALGLPANNYNITYVKGTFTVTARPVLTVRAVDASRAYGAANPAFTYTITGFINGDNQATATTGAPVLSTALATNANAGTYTGAITVAAGSLASNTYDFTFVPGTLQVTPRAITVTAVSKTKTYGDADPALTVAVTTGTLVGADDFSGNLSRGGGENIGSYAINQGTLAIGNNYDMTFVPGILTITKRAITVTAVDNAKYYGDVDPVFNYTFTPALVGSDAFVGKLERSVGETIGTYTINQGSLILNSNYAITFAPAVLTINKRPITLKADYKSKFYGNADPDFTYQLTAGTLVGSDAFTGKLERIAGENVGQYDIHQGSLNNPNYDITFEKAYLSIDKRSITLKANDATKVVGGTYTFAGTEFSVASGSLVAGDVITGVTLTSNGAPAGAAVGTYPILITNATGNTISNYHISYTSGTLTVTNRPVLTVTAVDASRAYGAANPAFTYTITGFINGDNQATATTGAPVLTTNISTTTDAATYIGAITVAPGSLASNTYDFTFVPGTLRVEKRKLTIAANNATKWVGQTSTFTGTEFQLTAGSLAAGDLITGIDLSSTGAAADALAGTYPIVVANAVGLSAVNYDITYVNGNLTVTLPAGATALSHTAVYEQKPIGTTVGQLSTTGSAFNGITYSLVSGYGDNQAFTISGDVVKTAAIMDQAVKSSYQIRVRTSDATGAYFDTDYTIAVDACATVSIMTQPQAQVTCTGTGVTFSVVTTGTAVSYQWMKDGTPINGAPSSDTYTIANATAGHTGAYSVVVTGCNNVATSTEAVLTVNAIPATPVLTAGGATTFCQGGSVELASSAPIGNQWYKDGAAITGATVQHFTATDAGNYTVQVMENGCASPLSTAIPVVITTVATPVITASGNVLTSTATTGNQWYYEGTAIAGATGQTHRVQASGRYTVQVSQGSCTATSAAYNFVATRVDNPSNWNSEVVVYPIPAHHTLYLKNTAGRKLQLAIYDINGKKVYSGTLSGNQGTIPVAGFANGVYQLKITDSVKGETITQRFTKY